MRSSDRSQQQSVLSHPVSAVLKLSFWKGKACGGGSAFTCYLLWTLLSTSNGTEFLVVCWIYDHGNLPFLSYFSTVCGLASRQTSQSCFCPSCDAGKTGDGAGPWVRKAGVANVEANWGSELCKPGFKPAAGAAQGCAWLLDALVTCVHPQ